MKRQEIIKQCLDKREQLLQQYIESLPVDQPIELFQIAQIVEQLEQGYKQFLIELWANVCREDRRTLDDILDKHYNRFALRQEYSRQIHQAQANAEEITLWEQITNSNYRDVAHLNALIRAYAIDLLAHITADFMEDLM